MRNERTKTNKEQTKLPNKFSGKDMEQKRSGIMLVRRIISALVIALMWTTAMPSMAAFTIDVLELEELSTEGATTTGQAIVYNQVSGAWEIGTPGFGAISDIPLTQGAIIVGNASGEGSELTIGAANTVPISNGTTLSYGTLGSASITDGSVTSTDIADGTITSTDLNANANITLSQLESLTEGSVIVGNASNDASALAIGAANEVLISNGTTVAYGTLGSGSITDGSITNADLNANADIAFTQLASLTEGSVLVGNASNDAAALAIGAANEVLISNGTTVAYGTLGSASITDGSVTSTDIANGTITNADLNANADIAFTQLASLTEGSVLVGNASNDAAALAIGAANEVLISNGTTVAYGTLGSASITDGSITSTDIADGTVTSTDIANGTITNADLSATADIAFTQLASLSEGSVLVGNASNDAAALAIGAANEVLISNGTTVAYGTLGSASITDNSVTSTDILDGTITADDLATGALNGIDVNVEDPLTITSRTRVAKGFLDGGVGGNDRYGVLRFRGNDASSNDSILSGVVHLKDGVVAGNNPRLRFSWLFDNGEGNPAASDDDIRFIVYARAAQNNTDISSGGALTAQNIDITGTTAIADDTVQEIDVALTNVTFSAGDKYLFIQIVREPDNGSDTHDGDVYVPQGISVEYTADLSG